ncbi:MAG: YqjK-like family protein [Rhodocyclaceae bacterium]|nr:YqjK-like family protein [Rhodocyclaceae bacterium]MBK9624733.1 YqjK-like family protein [Rhodocyclaceae bacterium]MBL0077176.1 YqjK-like family protein [Rhodocyclaceae bacterium]MBP6110245.1 YqjK-like family protein [Rhodocyclaceae bacterium]MBP6279346.1 YqjK-like family protein [Rhodocyclaceae bacterium]
MNNLEIALKKQRLLIKSEQLRNEFGRNGRGIKPAFQVADAGVAGVRWLQRHPEVIIGVAVTLVVAKPKAVLRWSQRAYTGWKTWQQISGFLEQNRPPQR